MATYDKRITIRLSEADLGKLRAEAKKRGVDPSEVIRLLIRDCLAALAEKEP
jgi:predicted DNA binding CopG/RHH family protein